MPATDACSAHRRRVHVGDGPVFEIESREACLEAEAIDLTPEGLGLAVVHATGDLVMPAAGDVVAVRGAFGAAQRAVVRDVGAVRTDRGTLPRVAVDRRDGRRFACPATLPAFATSAGLRIVALGAGGMTLTTPHPGEPLLPGTELDFYLHLAFAGVEHGRGRVTSARHDEVGVAWIDPSRALCEAISLYLLSGDETLTPAALRAGGLAVGSIERVVTYDDAGSGADLDAILALRLHAHQAKGHLRGASVGDLRSPFDAHARHLTCRFGGRIVGYVRVIFVDHDPARSQYVTLGGHEVPPWLWRAGFVEAGAGAIHPDFQRAGLFTPLMAHSVRVAVETGHRYVLGACDDGLLGMYREMGFEILESRIVEPKPGWRFRSHLICLDAERELVELAVAA
jgi:GNAT superfamily N-acetyltransferase